MRTIVPNYSSSANGIDASERLPFSVDRASRIKLPYQVADGLRSAIQSGYWKPGDRLPSSRDMKEMLGVSVRAPSEALQMLAREGLVTLREKCGAVVNAVHQPLSKGRVLLIVPDGAQLHAANILVDCVRQNLNEAGYLVVTTSVFKKGDDFPERYDLRQLEVDLKMTYSLLVLFEGRPPYRNDILQLLKEHGSPFVVVGGPKSEASNCIGGMDYRGDSAFEELARHCRTAQVRTAILFQKWKNDEPCFGAALQKVGVKVKRLYIPRRQGRGRKEELWSTAFDVFERLFRLKGRSWLPDLLCFTDDHCFWGAAISLLSHRVAVPRDVKIVTMSNVGTRPQFTCSVACIERDLIDCGTIVTRVIVDYLERGVPVNPKLSLGMTYVHGGTFP